MEKSILSRQFETSLTCYSSRQMVAWSTSGRWIYERIWDASGSIPREDWIKKKAQMYSLFILFYFSLSPPFSWCCVVNAGCGWMKRSFRMPLWRRNLFYGTEDDPESGYYGMDVYPTTCRGAWQNQLDLTASWSSWGQWARKLFRYRWLPTGFSIIFHLFRSVWKSRRFRYIYCATIMAHPYIHIFHHAWRRAPLERVVVSTLGGTNRLVWSG